MPHFLNQNFHQVLWPPLEVWLEKHPLMHWLLAHPLLMLILMLMGLTLLAGLMSAIAHLTQNLWLRLLQLPVQLVQSLGKTIASGLQQLFRRVFYRSSFKISNELSKPYAITDQPRKLDSVLTRSNGVGVSLQELHPLLEQLEQVRQEEAKLIEQIKILIDERSP